MQFQVVLRLMDRDLDDLILNNALTDQQTSLSKPTLPTIIQPDKIQSELMCIYSE